MNKATYIQRQSKRIKVHINSYKTEKSLRIPKGSSELVYQTEHTTQWPKEKVKKDRHRSTNHSHKTKDRVTRPPLKTGVHSGAPEG